MKLRSSELFLLSQCAISAVLQAGQIISQYSQHPVATNSKKGGSSLASKVVTEVDLMCQERILQTLLPTCDTFDLALLTEESPDNFSRLKKDFFWCIDPLDGTLPFIESTPGYAVSIALVARNGTPHIGVIYDPVEQDLFYAIKDYGVFRNGNPWKREPVFAISGQSLTFVTDRSFKQNSVFSRVVSELKSIASAMGYDGVNIIQHGGAVMNACWTLDNSPACYFKFPKQAEGGGSLWDYAATACLYLEAGAVSSDIFGQPLDLNRLDSTFLNHRGILYASDHAIAKRIMDLYTRLQ